MRTGTPYVRNAAPQVTVVFHNKAAAQVGLTYSNDGHGSTSRRVIQIDTASEPYTGTGTIRMENHDGDFNNYDLRGTKVTISWGWFSGTSSDDEPWWVVKQYNIVEEGVILCQLEIANAWEMLKRSVRANKSIASDMTTPDAGTTLGWDRATTTVKDILTAIFSDPNGFLGQWGYSTITTLGSEPAGAFSIQSYKPKVVTRIGEDDNALARRLLAMTRTGVTFRNSTGVTFNYVDPSNPGPYYVYQNDNIEHPFFINMRGIPLVIPNRVIVLDKETDLSKNQVTNFVGIAENSDSISRIGELADVYFDDTIGDYDITPTGPEITAGNLEADARAAAILARHMVEVDVGQLYVPMNCCLELYDEIKINETNPGAADTGRVARIERHFQASSNNMAQVTAQRELYTCKIFLGGIGGGSLRIKSYTNGNDIDAASQDMRSRGLHNPFRDSAQINGSVLSQHYAPYLKHTSLSFDVSLAGGGVVQILNTIAQEVKVPSVLKVNFNAIIAPAAIPGTIAIGDYVAVWIIVDSTSYGTAVFRSSAAGDFGPVSHSYMIPYLPDGATHTITMYAQQHSAAGVYIVSAGTTQDTDLMFEIVSARNATF